MTKHSASNESSRVSILLAEYRAMYDLAIFRMSALDRRAPVTAGVFAVAVGSLQSLPVASQLLVLIVTPPALVWLMRTTVNHARSFEDSLRRIEMMEERLNDDAKAHLIGFQSTHPSRREYVGGRTGRESVLAVFGSIILLLGAAGYQLLVSALVSHEVFAGYIVLLALVAAAVTREFIKLRRYRYLPSAEPTNLTR